MKTLELPCGDIVAKESGLRLSDASAVVVRQAHGQVSMQELSSGLSATSTTVHFLDFYENMFARGDVRSVTLYAPDTTSTQLLQNMHIVVAAFSDRYASSGNRQTTGWSVIDGRQGLQSILNRREYAYLGTSTACTWNTVGRNYEVTFHFDTPIPAKCLQGYSVRIGFITTPEVTHTDQDLRTVFSGHRFDLSTVGTQGTRVRDVSDYHPGMDTPSCPSMSVVNTAEWPSTIATRAVVEELWTAERKADIEFSREWLLLFMNPASLQDYLTAITDLVFCKLPVYSVPYTAGERYLVSLNSDFLIPSYWLQYAMYRAGLTDADAPIICKARQSFNYITAGDVTRPTPFTLQDEEVEPYDPEEAGDENPPPGTAS